MCVPITNVDMRASGSLIFDCDLGHFPIVIVSVRMALMNRGGTCPDLGGDHDVRFIRPISNEHPAGLAWIEAVGVTAQCVQ